MRRKASPGPPGRGADGGGRNAEQLRKVRGQFRQLDKDHSGDLSIEEITGFLKKLNKDFSENQIQRLFCEIDVNQNGTICFKEFSDYIFDGVKAKPARPRAAPRAAPSAPDVREEWKEATLLAHNQRRAEHGAPDLEWSDECYIEAKKQADACQARSSMFHGCLEGPSGRHGQNVYWCSRPGSEPEACTKAWYDELYDPGYDYSDPGFKGGTGHFTQVVWKGTTSVGMAASEDGCFVVANYFPAGNYMGQFEANVLPSTGSPAATGGAAPGRAAPAGRQEPVAAPRRAAPKREAPKREAPAASGSSTVEATSMTPELERQFAGCPFPFKDEAVAAFKEGGATVTATRTTEGRSSRLVLVIKTGCMTSEMRGSWGGG